jgi:hypothetical protein
MTVYQRNEYLLRGICIALMLATSCANPAKNKASAAPASRAAEISNEANQANDSHQADNSSKSAGTGIANLPKKIIKDSKNGLEGLSETSGYILELAKSSTENWPQRIIHDSKESFLRADNLSILLLAGGASVALHSSGADEKVADNFEDHHIFHGFTDESLNVVGHPWTQLGASALWYAISRKNQDDFNKGRAEAMIAALSVTGVATFGLKAIRHNDAPNGKDWAWPSGHVASSFTVASMLDEFYGPEVGVPAYAFASLIAYRMLDSGDHWTSDVVFGAALGWVVGHTFGAKQKQLEIAGFKVLPYTASNNGSVVGVNLVKRF